MADGQFTCERIAGAKCIGCGKETRFFASSGKPKKWCSPACRVKVFPKARRSYAHKCIDCGNEWSSKDDDSLLCIRCARRAAGLASGKARRERAKPSYSTVYFPSCSECGRRFATTHSLSHICSEECKRAEAARYARGVAAVERSKYRKCLICSGPMKPSSNWRRICESPMCEATHAENLRRTVREIRARREFRKRAGLAQPYDRISRCQVFDRDGWRCRNCGCETPHTLMGTNHADAPVLDHIIAIALGGLHVASNLQCLCRTCNTIKGAMTVEQWDRWNGRTSSDTHQ